MKNYPSAIREEYYRQGFIAVDLLEVHLYDENNNPLPYYFSNGGIPIRANSSLTGQEVVYTAFGEFMGFTSMSESLDVSVGKFSIGLSGLSPGFFNDLLTNASEGRRVVIKKVFLDLQSLQVIDQPITIYEGYIYNYALTEGAKTATLNLSCSSLFSDFERTNGRKTNNWSNWLFQGLKYDKAMDKAGFVGQTEFLWGRSTK